MSYFIMSYGATITQIKTVLHILKSFDFITNIQLSIILVEIPCSSNPKNPNVGV